MSLESRVSSWLDSQAIDQETKESIKELQSKNQEELTEAFYKDLEFGTGGLRGIMGIGSNRMNKYTIGMATQGLANYLNKNFPNEDIKVAIAHDSRNNSRFFAETTAAVFSANGIRVYLFESLRPTPELSYCIRQLKCKSGVVLTASHNPKEYNGYKAYWDDGGQLVPPHDKNVIDEVNKISSFDDVKFEGNSSLIEIIGEEIDKQYIEVLKGLSLSPETIQKESDTKIVYSSIHGTGIKMVPQVLEAFGFKNVTVVAEQAEPDGNFPTVVYPNPEEAEAMSLALKKAAEIDADLVMATDPDADRVGIAARNKDGEFQLLNGNQTGTLLIYYLLRKWQENNKLDGKQFIVKTIVTTDLIKRIANHFKVTSYDTLTGFKYIAELIKELEGKSKFIAGGEESYGYLVGDSVRDKDAVASCAMIAEMAAWARSEGLSVFDLMEKIYRQFGFFLESLKSITKKGKAGAEEIEAMMVKFRKEPPTTLGGSKVVKLIDYQSSTEKDLATGKEKPIDYPKSNVLQFFTEDESKVSIRPSGTEPKIKFYFSVNDNLEEKESVDAVKRKLEGKINSIISDLGL